MKIIRPIDLAADGVVESNAPGDDFLEWQPVGRNFLTSSDLVYTSVDNANGLAYFLSSNGVIREVDLDTGDMRQIGPTFPGAYQAEVVPTGGFIAVCWDNSSNDTEFRVVRLSDDQIVYTFTDGSQGQRVHFSYDGLRMLRTSGTQRLIAISTSTWSITQTLPNMEAVHQALSGSSQQWAAFFHSNQLSVSPYGDGPYVAVCYRATYRDQFQTLRRSGIARINYETGDLVGYTDGTPSDSRFQRLIHNPARGEIIVYSGTANSAGGAPTIFDDTTFVSGGLAPDLPTLSESAVRSQDGDEIAFRSVSTSPFWRRFDAASYAERPTLDSALPSSAFGVKYSSDFYVVRLSAGGYSLINRLDDTLVTETNPSVTTGDIYTYANHNYEALTDNNDRPDLGAIADPPTWLDLGAINPLRMFDGKLDSLTVSPSPLVIDIETGTLTNGVALFNVIAQTVQVTYTSAEDGLVYDSGEILMSDSAGVADWYGFFFEPYQPRRDLALLDLPAYTDGAITITVTGIDGDVPVGEVVAGAIYQIGDAQYGTSAGILDFSRKEQDQFGNFEIVRRRFSKRVEYDTVIEQARGGAVQRTLAEYRTTPVVWVGDERLEETIVYGYYRSFDILLSSPAFTNVTISVEGL